MPKGKVRLRAICQEAGVSMATARRMLGGHNPMRANGGHYFFAPEEVPSVLGEIAAKRKRICRNAFNSPSIEAPQSQL